MTTILIASSPGLAQSSIFGGSNSGFDFDVMDIDRAARRTGFDDLGDFGLLGSSGRLETNRINDLPADVRIDTVRTSNVDSFVDFDEDNVLLGIALDNNGFSIDSDELSNLDITRNDRLERRQGVDFDRDTVFNSIILGGAQSRVRDFNDVADITEIFDVTTSARRDIDLDENNVLLGIALRRSGGGGGLRDLSDIANINFDTRQEFNFDRTVRLDRNDALLSLVLG